MSRLIRQSNKLQTFDKQASNEITSLLTKIIMFTIMGDAHFLWNILATSLPQLSLAVSSFGSALGSFFLLGF
jgi:hypothetical protein